MKFKLGIVLLLAVVVFPTIIRAQVPVGRWEIVHLSGDYSAPDGFPGGFSTFLRTDGTGYTYGTFTSSNCVVDAERNNMVPTWVSLGGNQYQITITVDNLGLGPNFSFIYTGTYDPLTPIPGDSSVQIPTITGTYYGVGDVSACNTTTSSSPGNFVATFLPTLSSGSASGSLDAYSAANGSAFDSAVSATITFSTPPADGQIDGTVSLATIPKFNNVDCFATTNLTINPNLSIQSGAAEYLVAEGFDPQGAPTALYLDGFSVNLYTTGTNTDPNAIQVTSTDWAVNAAIGEDNSAAGTAGVSNDGTNTVMVFLYGVIGGACNNAGGVDAPFHFLSGTPTVHNHKKHHRRHHRSTPTRGRASYSDGGHMTHDRRGYRLD